MNCVIVYNGVSGSGKSCVVECIKEFYSFKPAFSKAAEYLGIDNIRVTNQGNCSSAPPINIGSIYEYSTVTEYSRLLVKLMEGPHKWIDDADYNLLCKYLRAEKTRNLLVKLKSSVESSYFGLTNSYILKCIDNVVASNGAALSIPSTVNLFFVSIREPQQIQDFVDNCHYPVRTLIISRPSSNLNVEDGYTEDIISNFKYDYSIINPESKDKILDAVKPVMKDILKDFAENTALTIDELKRIHEGGMEPVDSNGVKIKFPTTNDDWLEITGDNIATVDPWSVYVPTDSEGNPCTPV